ncbi:MAG: EpsG family protein [Clostridia bacterium]|nr:EpsG family protein [Clostridia bacterium]
MAVYIFMIIWVAVVGFMSKGTEVTEIIDGREEKRCSYTYSILIFSVIILFTGLRSSVGDTLTYIKNFNNLDVEATSLSELFWESNGYQLYYIYSYLIKRFVSDSATVFLFGIALISGIFSMMGFRRSSPDYGFSVLLFMLSGRFVWMMNGIKQFAAAALMFMAMKYITDKKNGYLYFALLLVAYLIHPSAILLLPAYFVVKGKPWSAKILLTVGLSLLAISFVGEFTDLLNFLTEDTVFDSTLDRFADDGGSNIMRFFVSLAPPLLAFLKRKEVERIATPSVNVMINMSVIAACCYLIATFTSGILFGRLPIYFELSGFCLIPWLLDNVYDMKDRKILKVLCVALYCVFFYFQVWGLEYTSRVLDITLY